MLKVLSIFGTRPEAIKMAPVVKKLAADDAFSSAVCVTAQHREMLDQVLDLFAIQPQFDLDLMTADQNLTHITTSVLSGVEGVIEEFSPDRVLVHGDTTTSFAAALASFYRKVPVAHVEAGLRTGNLAAPWPEELNRRLADTIADLHFAPTDLARRNLLAEGIAEDGITVTGNTVIDALLEIVEMLETRPEIRGQMEKRFPELDPGRRLILVTGHRRENFGRGFERICTGLQELARRGDIDILYPVHRNPNVTDPVYDRLGGVPNIHLTEPLDYLPFVYLMNRAHVIITDSGGIQEEAPSLGKPVLVMRDVTERPEALAAGTVKLVGTDAEAIHRETTRLLDDDGAYQAMSAAHNPYGDGKAAGRIVKELADDRRD